MSQAAYLQDMMGETASDLDTGPSEIGNFYANCNVLVTGGSGFLGKLIMEKILWSCPNVRTIFVIVRGKKGKSAEERFNEIFEEVIFDRLKKNRPNFIRKIVLVEGDTGELGLGLSSEERELLRTSHIVIHGAATVRFDEKLRIATNINVRGTKELLLLATEMPNLKAFVHISTAYSNCIHEVIEEKFYPPSMDVEKLLSLVDLLDDESLGILTPSLLGKWPNTYTFTKAIAEDVIRNKSENMPVCIVRPSIVIATYKEPIAGWINNFYGPVGLVVASGLGIWHVMYADSNLFADLIPADYVVNTVIAAAWNTCKSQITDVNTAKNLISSKVEELPVYNAVVSRQKPIRWKEFFYYNTKHYKEVPCAKSVWLCFVMSTKIRWLYNIGEALFHFFPAAIADGIAWLTGRKPMLWNVYKKIHKIVDVLAFFVIQQWEFHDDRVRQLMNKLNPTDRIQFDMDLQGLDWDNYFYHLVRGLRVYVVKDSLDTLAQGRARNKKLKIIHYTVVTIVCFILFWLLRTFLRLIGLW